MCGIVGRLNLSPHNPPIRQDDLRQMLAMIRHRGPDQFGIYHDSRAGLGSARLSIIDLSGGQQPICNEDGTLWIIFNGEIYNYIDLRPGLEQRGHQFSTNSDTEVILHLYEELGPACLKQFNGQFAIAIWDARAQTLFLARDRVGIRPLFYTVQNNVLTFGSEIKAILANPQVSAEIDPITLNQVFTYWSALSPRTIFKDIRELPPGHFLLATEEKITVEPYWHLDFSSDNGRLHKSEEAYVDEFKALLIDAAQIRLRADVPVGAYLSGGIDSSIIASIIRNYTGNKLDTFSVAFEDPQFDESLYQYRMADFLGTEHQVIQASYTDIGGVFPDVVWHTEIPLTRTGPAPLFLLSKLVQDHNYKVVLTGEGADEFLAGYNIFREAKVRRFWAKEPDSELRPLLLRRLYPYISDLSKGSGQYLAAFFKQGLIDVDSPGYSHAIRWRNNSRTTRFFSDDVHQTLDSTELPEVAYPPDFLEWEPLHRAQYLESSIFLPQYLLSSQGDRMAAAHSVEGRFPFLDHRVMEFCSHLPPQMKLRVLKEKYLLKRLGQEWLPEEIWQRPKQPYRAPIQRSFFGNGAPDYVAEVLSPTQIEATGLFKPAVVDQLTKKIERGMSLSETDEMALVGVLSTQLLHRQFIAHFDMLPPIDHNDDIKICSGD